MHPRRSSDQARQRAFTRPTVPPVAIVAPETASRARLDGVRRRGEGQTASGPASAVSIDFRTGVSGIADDRPAAINPPFGVSPIFGEFLRAAPAGRQEPPNGALGPLRPSRPTAAGHPTFGCTAPEREHMMVSRLNTTNVGARPSRDKEESLGSAEHFSLSFLREIWNGSPRISFS